MNRFRARQVRQEGAGSIRKGALSLASCLPAFVVLLWAVAVGAGLPAETAASSRAAAENRAGVEALRQERWDEAIEHFRRARRLEPGSGAVKRNLAGALNARAAKAANTGQLDEAERDFLEALAIDPDDATALGQLAVTLNNRGVELLGKRRLVEARSCFERAMQYLPRVADPSAAQLLRTNYSNFLTAEGNGFFRAQQIEQARRRRLPSHSQPGSFSPFQPPRAHTGRFAGHSRVRLIGPAATPVGKPD